MRYLIVAIAMFISTVVSAKTQQQILENTMKMTVMVTNEGFTGTGARGSGILINETTVLTCFHLLAAPTDTLYVYTYPFGQVIKAHPDRVSPSQDIAFLKLETPVKLRVKPFFQSNVQVGERIYAIGNSLGSMQWVLTSGIVSTKESFYILSDMPINPGTSGGPWVNEKGEIVGMTDWRIGPVRHVPGIAGAISGKVLHEQVYYYLNPEALMKKFLEALFGVEKSTETKKK